MVWSLMVLLTRRKAFHGTKYEVWLNLVKSLSNTKYGSIRMYFKSGL
jgi:hypothetical protein